MVKKILMAAAAITLMMITESVLAQTTDMSKYFTVKELGIRTTKKYTYDFQCENYHGEQMWAGLQSLIFVIRFDNDDEKEGLYVDSQNHDVWFTDVYGRHVKSVYDTPDIKDDWYFFLETFEWGIMGSEFTPPCSFDLARGGEYVFNAVIDFMNIDRHDAVTVYDYPSIRIGAYPSYKVGEDVEVRAFFNTGYPYDINSLTGEEYADVTLYRKLTDSTAVQLDKQRFALSRLKDEAHPLLAGIDTVTTKMLKPEPGEYVLRYETNWQAVESRGYTFVVKDTLRASVALDKEAYDLASDKQARMTLKMDYRYPHIHAVEPDAVPTICVAASLLKDTETTDYLMTDTLTLVSDTLALKDLNYVGDWNLDLSKIDASKLADGDSTYHLKVNITFNNEQQYETFIPVNLKAVATGISPVATLPTNDEAVYTISGIRVKPLTHGIYIRKGKKIIIK